MQYPITLGDLQKAFRRQNVNFICYAAENYIQTHAPLNDPDDRVQVDSMKFWRELYRIAPEMFQEPPPGHDWERTIIDLWLNESFVDEQWLSKETIAEHSSLVAVPGRTRKIRTEILQLLVDQCGAETILEFEYSFIE